MTLQNNPTSPRDSVDLLLPLSGYVRVLGWVLVRVLSLCKIKFLYCFHQLTPFYTLTFWPGLPLSIPFLRLDDLVKSSTELIVRHSKRPFSVYSLFFCLLYPVYLDVTPSRLDVRPPRLLPSVTRYVSPVHILLCFTEPVLHIRVFQVTTVCVKDDVLYHRNYRYWRLFVSLFHLQ